jgi:hypothetical protein
MKKYLLFFLILVFVFGCASVPLQIANQEPKNKNYEVLGEGVGSASGLMLFQVIPIGQNTRFRNAYRHAIESKNGDDLIDVEITEQWFWAYILNGYTTTVKGTVIKYKK